MNNPYLTHRDVQKINKIHCPNHFIFVIHVNHVFFSVVAQSTAKLGDLIDPLSYFYSILTKIRI